MDSSVGGKKDGKKERRERITTFGSCLDFATALRRYGTGVFRLSGGEWYSSTECKKSRYYVR